ncbi:MAG: hypothetical protein MJ051_03675 [Akkermansia sp.]|nr:hypothetical protein [Akkermansia sp.]
MKLRLPNKLMAAVLAAAAPALFSTLSTATLGAGAAFVLGAAAQAAADPAPANAGDTSQTMHVYILTGQSNAQGAVYASPASPAQLEQYKSGAIMWNSSLNNYSTNPVFAADNVTWRDVAPQLPIWGGNYSMGGEYGFASMMERLAGNENVTKANGERLEIGQLAVIKAALNGGGNQYWVKGNAAYQKMLEGMKNALQTAVNNGYQSVSIDGLMYLQGESNDGTGAGLTESRYKEYVANLTSDLSAWVTEQGLGDKISVAFDGNTVLGEPSRNPSGTIEKQIAAATSGGHVNTDGNGIGFVYARDLAKGADNLHYTGESQLSIGARYAYALAVQEGYDVGAVRGSDSTKALDNAGAWWMEQLPATDAVVKWDVSSVAKTNTISNSLSVGGIVVEDPYQGQVNISGGTLHVGAQGIELKQGSLNVSSAFVADAPQTWKVAGGRTLNLSNAGTISNTISLINDSGSGTAHVSVNGATQSWHVTGDVDLKVASAHAVTTAAGASLGLGAVSGSELALDSLSLGANTTLSVGGAGTAGTLTVGSLTLGGDASVNMDFMGSTRYDKLALTTLSGDGTVNFNFNVTKTGRGGSFTVVQGWNGGAFTYSGLDGLTGASFAADGKGNLVLTLAGGTGPAVVTDYTKDWPAGTPTAVSLTTGAYDASAHGSNTCATGSAQWYFGVGHSGGNETPLDNYAEIHDAAATWVVSVGSTSGSSPVTVVGDSAVRYTGDTTTSGTTVYGAVNATVTGAVYTELDKANATYTEVNGTHNATITGSNTLVIKQGIVNGTVTGGSVSGGNRISGGTYLQIDDGTFKGVVAGGNKAGSAVIDNGSHLVINGGTFSADVAGGNNGNGTINDGVQMVIDGGTFNANVAGGNNGVGIINGGVDMHIAGGTFNGYVYGGNLWGSNSASATNSIINGDINMEISGGTFNNAGSKAVYATGYGYKVDGDVTLTLSGGTFASGYHLYTGGWNGASVTEGHKTTLVLQDIDSSNALATADINLHGTGSAAPELVFSHVTTAVAANFSGFTTLRVTDESDAVLARNVANHTALLGALTGGITVEEGSNLTLLHPTSGPWDLTSKNFTLEEGGSLTKSGAYWTNIGKLTGEGTYHIAGTSGGSQVKDLTEFDGTVHIAMGNKLEMTNAGSAGTTFLVDKGGEASLKASAGKMGTLSGEGLVTFRDNVTLTINNNHSSFDFDNWTGTVKLVGADIPNASALNLSKLGCEGSTIEINGVGASNSVYLATGTDKIVTADIHLSGSGLKLDNGYSNGTTIFKGAWTGTGGFTFSGGPTQTFRFLGNMTDYAGNISLSGGQSLEFGNGDVSVNLGIAATSDTGKGTISGTGATTAQVKINYLTDSTSSSTMTGNLALTQNGAQVLTVLGHNTYTGATNINNGSVKLEGDGTLGTGTVTLSAANSASLILDDMTLSSLNKTTNATISGQQEGSISATGIRGTEGHVITIANAAIEITGSSYVLEYVNTSSSKFIFSSGSNTEFETNTALGSIEVDNGTTTSFAGDATISGSVSNSGVMAVNGTLSLTGGRGNAWDLGSVTGEGTIVANSTNGNRVYTMSGDLKDWTGKLEQSSGSGNMTLNITGTEELKADIVNKAKTSADCKLDVNLLHDMTVSGDMSYTDKGLLNVAVGDASHQVEAALESTITANSLTVAKDSAATISEGTVQITAAAGGAANITLTKADGDTAASLSGTKVTTTALSAATSGTKATVENTAVSVGNNATVAITNVALTDSDITVADGAAANLSHATVAATTGSTLNGVTVGEDVSAHAGDGASLSFINQASSINLTDLIIGNGATVNAYLGTPTPEQITAAQGGAANIEADITVTGTLSAGSGATLNANLTLADGAVLDITAPEGLHMGSSLTLSQGAVITLSDNLSVAVQDMVRGDNLVLFTGVDAFTIDGAAYDESITYTACNYINLDGVRYADGFVIKYEVPAGSVNGGVVSLYMATPEPATTTLSLLALAGLAARRRRH